MRNRILQRLEAKKKAKRYGMGGMNLPGGSAVPIEGSDAVEFVGQTHDDGGIMVDSQTEVEDKETMDEVTMAKGGKKDYFFSSYLKKGGRSYADMHKQILAEGGGQEDIDYLAKMQESAAGRNPKQVAAYGGVKQYQEGGQYPMVNGKEMNERQKAFHDQQMSRGKVWNGTSYTNAEDAEKVVEQNKKNY